MIDETEGADHPAVTGDAGFEPADTYAARAARAATAATAHALGRGIVVGPSGPVYRYLVREVTSVWDGDTFHAIVDQGFRNLTEQRFRLLGVDAPELYGEDREGARRARQALTDILFGTAPDSMLRGRAGVLPYPTPTDLLVVSVGADKYNRWDCSVIRLPDGLDVASELLRLGVVVPYPAKA